MLNEYRKRNSLPRLSGPVAHHKRTGRRARILRISKRGPRSPDAKRSPNGRRLAPRQKQRKNSAVNRLNQT